MNCKNKHKTYHMPEEQTSWVQTLKIVLAIVLTGGLIVLVWTVKKYMDHRMGKTDGVSGYYYTPEVHEERKSRGSKLRIAFGLAAIAALMFAIYGLELDQYFMTSLLNAEQKRAIVAAAQSKVGATYQLGSTGPGSYDCSGFTGSVIQEALGVSLPRTSRDMYTVGREITFDKIDVGDLVFFATSGDPNYISHVGVVTERQGDKVYMTNANSYYGKVMKEEISGYWLETYVGARELTNVTATMNASDDPDPTYVAPVIENDQYDDNFPPSENNDPRVSVGSEVTDSDSDTEITTDQPDDDVDITPEVIPAFSDVPESHPNFKAIQYLKKEGVIGGYGDGTFKPDRTVTRAEALKIALNGAGFNTNGYQNQASTFTDVDTTHSLHQYINYAKANNIVGGYPDGTYKPNLTVTRGEAAKILINISGINPPQPTSDPYSDVPMNLELAKYISYVQTKNLLDVTGVAYKIDTAMTRGDIAEMMYRLIVLDKTGASKYSSLLSI